MSTLRLCGCGEVGGGLPELSSAAGHHDRCGERAQRARPLPWYKPRQQRGGNQHGGAPLALRPLKFRDRAVVVERQMVTTTAKRVRSSCGDDAWSDTNTSHRYDSIGAGQRSCRRHELNRSWECASESGVAARDERSAAFTETSPVISCCSCSLLRRAHCRYGRWGNLTLQSRCGRDSVSHGSHRQRPRVGFQSLLIF